ncbi:hypothetical protein D9M68_438610 [compost metagenome]
MFSFDIFGRASKVFAFLLAFVPFCVGWRHYPAPDLMAELIAILLLSMLIVCGGDRRDWWGSFFWGLFFGGLVNVIFGFVQVLRMDYYFPFVIPADSATHSFGVYGNIGQRNLFSAYVLVAGAIGVCLLRRIGVGWLGVIVVSSIFALLLAVAGGRLVLIYLVFLLLLCWFGRSRKGWIDKAALLVFSYAVLVFQFLLSGVSFAGHFSGASRVSSGFQSRLSEWSKAVEIGVDHWPYGSGVGTYASQSFLYQVELSGFLPWSSALWDNAHNIFLMLFAELGVFGVLVFVVWMCSVVFCVLRSTESEKNFYCAVVVGVLSIHSFFEYPLWNSCFLIIFLISLLLSIGPVLFKIKQPIMLLGCGGILFSILSIVDLNRLQVGFKGGRVVDGVLWEGNPIMHFYRGEALVARAGFGVEGAVERLCMVESMVRQRPAVELLDRYIAELILSDRLLEAKKVYASRLRVYPVVSQGWLFMAVVRGDESKWSVLDSWRKVFVKHGAEALGTYYKLERLDGC